MTEMTEIPREPPVLLLHRLPRLRLIQFNPDLEQLSVKALHSVRVHRGVYCPLDGGVAGSKHVYRRRRNRNRGLCRSADPEKQRQWELHAVPRIAFSRDSSSLAVSMWLIWLACTGVMAARNIAIE